MKILRIRVVIGLRNSRRKGFKVVAVNIRGVNRVDTRAACVNIKEFIKNLNGYTPQVNIFNRQGGSMKSENIATFETSPENLSGFSFPYLRAPPIYCV